MSRAPAAYQKIQPRKLLMLLQTLSPLIAVLAIGISPIRNNAQQPVDSNDDGPPASVTQTAASTSSAASDNLAGVTKGSGVLPNDHGQIWREYDISPYTSRVTTSNKPEQAVIDWILRETGTDIWFTEPLGILNATTKKLRVYHTPQTHETVREIYQRLVNSKAESHVFGLHLVTIGSPNWRTLAHQWMRPVAAQSPGVEAWLLNKENAAVLKNQLNKRLDFREHNSPNLVIHNGQPHVLSRRRPRNYIRLVRGQADAFPASQVEMAQIQEGYRLEFSPLVSLDGEMIDAVVKCDIDQVEKFVPIVAEVPNGIGQVQRLQIQVPQISSWRLHERFRWPEDQVLLLSCGVVATPGPSKPTAFGIPNPFDTGPGRADALLFIESKGTASQALIENPRTANGNTPNYRGRY
jgi:hypothetical protein